MALNPYSYYCWIDFCRSDLGLSLSDLPPAVPTVGPNYVEELAIANNGGLITLKLRVPSLPAQYTVVQGAFFHNGSWQCPPDASMPIRLRAKP